RLARNSADWHRLLEICALADTLSLDEDGIYDPAHFNDRLLLGLKGTMSEAELHVLRARLRGGLLNKARRGELRCPLPAGMVYDAAGRVVLDPDKQVQETVRLLLRPSLEPAHCVQRSFTSVSNICSSRLVWLRVRTRVSWFGRRCRWAAPAPPCIARGMRELTPLAGAVSESRPTDGFGRNDCRGNNGRC